MFSCSQIYAKDNFFSMSSCKCDGEVREVAVIIPKFKMEADLDLKPPLEKMGVKEVFKGGAADLTGLTKKSEEELYVSDVIQKCVIKVNEEGSEASAATAVVVERFRSKRPKSRVFNANKPFLYFIVCKTTGMILFSGRMVDPSLAKYEAHRGMGGGGTHSFSINLNLTGQTLGGQRSIPFLVQIQDMDLNDHLAKKSSLNSIPTGRNSKSTVA